MLLDLDLASSYHANFTSRLYDHTVAGTIQYAFSTNRYDNLKWNQTGGYFVFTSTRTLGSMGFGLACDYGVKGGCTEPKHLQQLSDSIR